MPHAKSRFAGMLLLHCLVMAGCGGRLLDDATLPARIVFLDWDAVGHVQLYQTSPDGANVTRLLSVPDDVTTFEPSPDGRRIAFVSHALTGADSLWTAEMGHAEADLAVTCLQAQCGGIVWHPDSSRLLYEKRILDGDGTPGPPGLWWLDVNAGESVPLFKSGRSISQAASFSHDGEWLSFAGSPDEGLFLFRLDDGTQLSFPSELGTPAEWSPDGESVLLQDHEVIVLHSEEGDDHEAHSHDFAVSVHLFRVNILSGERSSLSGDSLVDDGSAAWSPDGNWIAFGRQLPRTAMGRQLWLVRPDGNELHPLTDEPELHHGSPSWSPDGRTLLYQRVPALDPEASPSIWTIDVTTGQQREIVPRGFHPRWLPLAGGRPKISQILWTTLAGT